LARNDEKNFSSSPARLGCPWCRFHDAGLGQGCGDLLHAIDEFDRRCRRQHEAARRIGRPVIWVLGLTSSKRVTPNSIRSVWPSNISPVMESANVSDMSALSR